MKTAFPQEGANCFDPQENWYLQKNKRVLPQQHQAPIPLAAQECSRGSSAHVGSVHQVASAPHGFCVLGEPALPSWCHPGQAGTWGTTPGSQPPLGPCSPLQRSLAETREDLAFWKEHDATLKAELSRVTTAHSELKNSCQALQSELQVRQEQLPLQLPFCWAAQRWLPHP